MKFENIFGRSKSEENKPVEYFTFRQDLIDKPLDSLSQEELAKLRNDLAEQYQKGINTEQSAAVDKKIAEINILTGSDTKPNKVEIPSWDPKSGKSTEDQERDKVIEEELAIKEEPKEELSHEEKMERLNETLAPEPQENPAETLSDEERMERLNKDLTFEPVGNPTENLSDSERVEKVDEILNNKSEGEPASAEVAPAAEEEKDPEFWNKNKIIDAPEENEGESSKMEAPPAEENVPAAPEVVENRKETINYSLEEIENIAIAELGKKAKVKNLKITESEEGLKLTAELDGGMKGGKISIDGIIENTGKGIALGKTNVDARGYVKPKVEEGLSKLDANIKEYFEIKNKKNVSSMRIVGSNLVVDYEVPSEVIKTRDSKEQNPEISEAEIEKDQKEIEAEIEKMTPEEKEKVGAAFRNIGFKAKEWSHATIADLLEKASKNSSEDSAIGRILISSKKKFEEYTDKDREKARSAYDKEGHYIARNSASLATTALRFGRIITDITGRTAAAPLRYFMIGGKAAGAVADILQDARFSNKELIEKNRTNNKEGYDEAWNLYDEALKKKLEKNKTENVGDELEEKNVLSAEDLKQAYFENMPADLVKRIEREPKEALNLVQRLVKWDLGDALERLKENIDNIDKNPKLTDEEKKEKKAILLRKQERNLHDYDRMLSQYGTVDSLAMLGKYAKTASKTVVYAVTAQTAGLVLENLWHHASDMISHFDFIHHAPTESDTAHIRSGSSERVQQIIFGHDSSAIDTAHAHADSLAPDTTHAATVHDSIPSDTTSHIGAAHDSVATSPAESATSSEIHGLEGGHIPEPEEGVIPPEINGLEGGHIPLPENMEIIHHGSSVVQTAEDMIRHGQITQEQFDAAWHNPDSIVSIHGEPMHISHAALVHEGNGIRFVPGENGGAPRFEVVEADGPEIGSDQDLLARYHELGKKSPEWLEKAVHTGTGGHHDLAPDGHEVSAPDHGAAGDNVAANADKIPNYSDHYSEAGDYNTALEQAGYTTGYEPHLAMPTTGEQHFGEIGDLNVENVENLTPESLTEAHELVENVNYEFYDLPLSEQEKIVNDLTSVHERLGKVLENGQDFDDTSKSEMIETKYLIESMQNKLLETEQAFKDRLYSFGFKKPGEYERIFGGKKVSVKSLLNEAEKTHDDRFEKLAKFMSKLKPSQREKALDVTTFLKSRFRY